MDGFSCYRWIALFEKKYQDEKHIFYHEDGSSVDID